MLIVFALLPPVLIMTLWRRLIPDWRDRVLAGSIVWGVTAVGMLELLSVLDAIVPWTVCTGWGLLSAAVVAGAIRLPTVGHRAGPDPAAAPPAPAAAPPAPAAAPPAPAAGEPAGTEPFVLIPQLLLIAAVLGVAAWVCPPNNFDSMTYHMPRVMHWMQDRNVAFYPTGSLRQVELAPGAEYLILHVQMLGRTDHWADMVQWFAYVGSVIGVSVVARSIGGRPRAQVLAAVFAATLPMACLQSGTTQNDLVSAFWFVCSIATLLRLASPLPPRPGWACAILCGGSLGLGVLTKSTMYPLAAPMAGGLGLLLLWRHRLRGLGWLALAAMLAASLNGPTWVRNHRFSHCLLGNGGYGFQAGHYTNAHPGIGPAVSNMLRNAGLELVVDCPPVSGAVEHAVRTVHRWAGLDPDDQATIFNGFTRYDLSHIPWNSEDYSSSPFHAVLIFAAVVTMIIGWRRSDRAVRWYAAGVGAGFVLFCAFLRYQPWHCRLLLPPMIASAAFVAVALDRRWKHGIPTAVFALLPLLAVPWVLDGCLHPMIGPGSIFDQPREQQYFRERPTLLPAYRSLVDLAAKNGVRQVGVTGDGNAWEYPLTMLLRERLPDVRVDTFPDGFNTTAQTLHTRNRGYDPNLKPALIVRLGGDKAEVVRLIPN
jgi:hypothetical protein